MQVSKKIAIEYNSQIATNSIEPLSAHQILKIMKYLNIESNYHKKQNKQQKQTKSNDGRYADNILNRKYNANINNVVTSDLTDASTSSAMNYVCFIVDLWNKEIVGANISNKHNTKCVLNAIDSMKIPIDKYTMFHSDRGGEFASEILQNKLDDLNIQISMSNPGCPCVNAISENMFKLLKTECLKDYYKDVNELYVDVDKWIKWYNNVRIHSGLNYKSPSQVRLEQAIYILM